MKKISAKDEEIAWLLDKLRARTALVERYESDLFKLFHAYFAELDMVEGSHYVQCLKYRYLQEYLALLFE
jgi:hypothetical protein